jgi:hypothetical protein
MAAVRAIEPFGSSLLRRPLRTWNMRAMCWYFRLGRHKRLTGTARPTHNSMRCRLGRRSRRRLKRLPDGRNAPTTSRP